MAGRRELTVARDRIIILAGPSRGKSTLAHELHPEGYPVYCGDPASTVRYQKPYTTYLPEGLDFAGDRGASAWVAEHWFGRPGPWICEGHVMARALRRWLPRAARGERPADRIIVLDKPAHRPTTAEQEAMHKAVMTVWRSIERHFPWAEVRR